MRMRVVVHAAVGLFVSLCATQASAGTPPKLPFDFDPTIAADPTETQQEITKAESGLPSLPLSELQTLKTSGATLYTWPEMAAALARAGTSGPGAMSWPSGATMCAKHASFAMPGAPTAACKSADAALRAALADLGACKDVEQPELYALGYKPASPDATVTGSIEGLIGLAGEALSHASIPANLLPPDFVPTLRTILLKIRHDTLASRVAQAHAGYTQALAAISASPSCFDASLSKSIGDLAIELDAASALLAKTKSDGEAEHAHEDICMAAHARSRVALPYASLTDDERRFIAFWLGGTYWRMRGGGLMPLGSTQAARWDFLEQPFTRIGELTGGKDGADAAFQIYLAVFEGWGDWMDMGETKPGGDKYFDLVGMTARGSRQVATAAQTLASRSYDTLDLTTGGLGMGPCYFWGHEQLASFRYADQMQSPPYGAFIEGFTAIGEWCSGASIALGFAKTLLAGTPTGKPPTVTLCTNRTCGDDTCGGSCGTCGAGLTCDEGRCVGPASPTPPASETAPPASSSASEPASPASEDTSASGCAIGSSRTSSPLLLLIAIGSACLRRSSRMRVRCSRNGSSR